MGPKLRVLVSSSSAYPPTAPITVNSSTPTPISTPGFEGNVWVFVKDYAGDHKEGDGKEYFEEDGRGGMTYGIVVKGNFLEDLTADEVVFGNTFERSIKDSLPWGTSVATKFIFIDPTLELDIYADKPWALSPALATMNYLSLEDGSKVGRDLVVKENSLEFIKSKSNDNGTAVPAPKEGNEKIEISARRKWLANKENRKKIKLGKDVAVGMEFANGLLDFNTLSATLPPPFSVQFPLIKYWDGQPVTYVCQRKAPKGQSPVGQDVFWSVAFEIVDDDLKKELEKRGGKGAAGEEGAKNEEQEGERKETAKGKGNGNDEDDKVSDDVD
ncbi:hypothetical protein I309_04725 [Cryptococcus deuterogattii LA55]|nr:hypothetical protein I309_04725 [Cryptococcus deuterogattii LA55]KIR89951.1 hypothetical protein I304_06198 [Cryptococcus deuterogattii CBS 10090]